MKDYIHSNVRDSDIGLPSTQEHFAISIPGLTKNNDSPATTERSKQTLTRLINAQEMGALEAKKIIEIFEKKKEEISTQFCESSEKDITERQNCFKQPDKNRRVKEIDEELNEEILFIKDLDDGGPASFCRYHSDKKDHLPLIAGHRVQKSLITRFPPCYACDNVNFALANPTNCKDVSIQHCSIFNNNLSTTRSIEVQHRENDIPSDILRKNHSETSVQCNIYDEILEKTVSNDKLRIASQCDHYLSETLGGNEKLKFVLKKLINHQKSSKFDAWRNYINDLKTKHRPDVRLSQTLERLETFDHANIPSPPTSLPRRVQSTFVLDDFDGRTSDCTSKYRSDPYEIKTPRCISPFSSTYSPKSTFFEDICPHQQGDPQIFGQEFVQQPIKPFCFSSILTNSMHCDKIAPRAQKLCRNVYGTPVSNVRRLNFGAKSKKGQSFMDPDKLSTEYLNKWLERPDGPYKKEGYPKNDEFIQAYKFNTDNVTLPVVPEEYINSPKRNKKKQSYFSKGEPNDAALITDNKNISKISLSVIENKLDTLINSIHYLMEEVKNSRSQEKKSEEKQSLVPTLCKSDCSRYLKFDENLNKAKSDPIRITAGDKLLQSVGQMILANSDINMKGIISSPVNKGCDIQVIVSSKTRTKSTNTLTIEPFHKTPVQPKEVTAFKEKQKRIRQHYVQCEGYPHALQLTVDFIGKDFSNKDRPKKEKVRPTRIVNRCVNTDPCTTQQISNEGLNSLWSIVPIVEYFWSLLPVPQLCKTVTYVCEICKQPFSSALELSDHIKVHYGDEKDCNTCQELMKDAKDSNKRTIRAVVPLPKLFTCKHCGQAFTRAYARQLHEVTCEKNKSKGRKPSLVVLS